MAVRYNFYGVFLNQGKSYIMRYGRQNYDHQDGTLVFTEPGQVVNIAHIDPDSIEYSLITLRKISP